MEQIVKSTLSDFCQSVGSNSFAPGGGCVSALSGALSASLAKMVLLLTVGKKKYAEFDAENNALLQKMNVLQMELLACVDRDLEGCRWVEEAMSLPRETDADKARRKNAMSEASKRANEAPISVCENALKLMNVFKAAINKVNRNTITDWACGALQAYAALEGAAMNAKINCGSIDDHKYCHELQDRLRQMLGEGRNILDEVRNHVHSSLDSSN